MHYYPHKTIELSIHKKETMLLYEYRRQQYCLGYVLNFSGMQRNEEKYDNIRFTDKKEMHVKYNIFKGTESV